MKTCLLVFLLLLSISLVSQAQDAEREFKHDIGINTSFALQNIFESNRFPFSVIYKTYSAPNKATRIGGEFNFSLS